MKTTLSIMKNNLVLIFIGILFLALTLLIDINMAIKAFLVLIALTLMWKNPMYGIPLYILGIPYLSDMNLLLLGIGVIGFFVVSNIRKDEFEFDFAKVDILLIIFLIFIVVNTILSIDPSGSIRDFVLHFVSLGLIFVLINNRKKTKDLYLINVVLVLVATSCSFYGIYQFVNGVPMGSGWVDPTQNPNLTTRVFATFENPNLLAEYLIMIFPVSLGLIVYNKDILKKIVFSLTSVVILTCIGLTYSRGAWVGLALGVIVFVLLLNRKAILGFIPIALLGILFLPTSIIQRILTIGNLQDTSTFYRISVWEKSIDIIKDFWYSGIGLGYIPFQQIVPLYIKSMAPYHAHNTLLQLAIELGIVGLIVFLLLIFFSLKQGLRIVFSSQSRFTKIFTLAYMTSLISILTHGFAEHIFFNPKIILTFWLIFGIFICFFRVYKKEQQEG